MSNFRKIIKTIGSSGLGFVVNILITLMLVPYITDLINAEAYGWVKVAKDTIVYCTMLTLAIRDFSTRYIGISYHQEDYDEADTYYSSVFFGETTLGLFIFCIAMIIVSGMENYFQISPELVADVKLLFLFTMLKFLQMTAFAVFECGPVITNRMYIVGRFKLLSYIIEAAALVFFYHFFSPHVYWVGLALLLSSLVITVPNIVICGRYADKLKISLSKFSIKAMGRMVGRGIWSSLNTINNILNSGLDLLVANWILTPLRMGQLALVQSISGIYTSVNSFISPAFQPMILESYSRDDHHETMRWFYLSMKACSYFCSLFFAAFVVLGPAFYRLWVPHQDTELLYRLTVIMIIPAITGGIITPMYYSYILTVSNRIPFFFSFFCGLLNVGSMVLLLSKTDLELYAVVGTTALFLVLNHLVANGLYICYVLDEPRHIFYLNVLRCLAATGIMTGVFYSFNLLINASGWISLIVTGTFFAAIGICIYTAFALNSSERDRILSLLKKKGGIA
ncbi:MAG: hypothetical protein IJH92_09720 [Mogibacterium sp.]|nr:hypothetical protein [Mogibacterium sp.]